MPRPRHRFHYQSLRPAQEHAQGRTNVSCEILNGPAGRDDGFKTGLKLLVCETGQALLAIRFFKSLDRSGATLEKICGELCLDPYASHPGFMAVIDFLAEAADAGLITIDGLQVQTKNEPPFPEPRPRTRVSLLISYPNLLERYWVGDFSRCK
jgi:hypothetical protein